MKRILLIAVILSVTAGITLAQYANAHISFETDTHDFGRITEEGGNVSYKFVFSNLGNEPLIISNVQSSCGCTSPDWTRKPVLPGEQGFVMATYHPLNRPGAFTKAVKVKTNDPDNLEVTLTITGDVVPKPKTIEDEYPELIGKIRFTKNSVNFGIIKNTEEKMERIDMTNTSSEVVKLSIDNAPSHLALKFYPAILNPGDKGYLEIKYAAMKKNDWDFVNDEIIIKQNDKKVADMPIGISATIQEDFSTLTKKEIDEAPILVMNEKTFDFGTVTEGQEVTHEFKLSNTGKRDLIIRKVRTSGDFLVATLTPKMIPGGKEGTLKVTYKTDKQPGRQNKTVTLVVNDPKMPRVVIVLKGNVQTATP